MHFSFFPFGIGLATFGWKCNILPNIILCLSHNILLGSLPCTHNSYLVDLNLLILAELIFKLNASHQICFIFTYAICVVWACRNVKKLTNLGRNKYIVAFVTHTHTHTHTHIYIVSIISKTVKIKESGPCL